MDEALKQNIIKDLELDRFPPERQEEMLLMIGKLIYQGVIIRVMGLLSEKDKEEFDNLLMEKVEDENAIFKFLESKIPNLNELVSDEVTAFKKESINFIKNLK